MDSPLDGTQVGTQSPPRARGWKGKLTDEQIRRGAKPADEPYALPDAHGLHVVIRPSGAKVFFLKYRIDGKQRKLKIGSYPSVTLAQARAIAARRLGEIASGKDPASERAHRKAAAKEVGETFSVVLQRYIKTHVSRLRSSVEIERILTREGLSRWGAKPIAAIDRRSIRQAIDEIEQRAPVMALNVFAHLHHFFAWCLDREALAVHPMSGMRRPPKGRGRDRVLDDTELVAVWNAVGEIEPEARDIVRLLILLGCRRSEAADLQWDEIDVAGRRIVLPAARMKADQQHVLFLSDFALSLILLQPSAAERKGSVFEPIRSWSRMKARLDAKLPPNLAAFVLHDIRRSVASHMQALNIMPVVIERVLGHAVGGGPGAGIRQVYQKYPYHVEARQALQQWSDHIERLTQPPRPAGVVRLRRRARQR